MQSVKVNILIQHLKTQLTLKVYLKRLEIQVNSLPQDVFQTCGFRTLTVNYSVYYATNLPQVVRNYPELKLL